MSALATEAPVTVPRMLELELTGKCQLRCTHCFGNFGPQGDPSTMTAGDWKSVIDQAAAIGVRVIQLIGGEVTLDPCLPELGLHALDRGLLVNVYSNLVKVPEDVWDLLARPGASLSTSWYSADPAVHEQVTGSRAAWRLTRRSIVRAVKAGIPLRVSIVGVLPEQDLEAAEADLRSIGATSIRVRPVQALGRAASDGNDQDPAQLCGHCGSGHATILASGQLAPCGMSRWLGFGSARDTPLAELLAGEPWRQALAVIPPKVTACQPNGDADNCAPDDESICPVEGVSLLPLVAAG
jgi:MoaA/NifB/PqqE/SkfB family radical SAM enzyme